MQTDIPDLNNLPVLLGIYPQGWPGYQQVIDTEFLALDAWMGKRLSIGGSFLDIEIPYPLDYVKGPLEMLWKNGYTPFVNLTTSHTAREVARGEVDIRLNQWAQAFASFARDGECMAFIAPLHEMNSRSSPYGLDPKSYKEAYRHIQEMFHEQGIPRRSIRWVFAPMGWNYPGDPPFEDYYPGDSVVNIVGFSSFNNGYYPNPENDTPAWLMPRMVFRRYLERMMLMAVNKPIFICQTGTSAWYEISGVDKEAKNQWLREAYIYLATYPGVRAVLYYNLINMQGVDWPFWVNDIPSLQYQGFRHGISNPAYDYLLPSILSNIRMELIP